ncbi:methylmalonyl-CoA mutase cobalamin-binding subunit [Bradyrhizobium sp. LM2.9]
MLNATPVALAPYGEQKYKFDALSPIRLAEPFEALRDKSDAALKARGARPKVFLANLGTPADFTARATFAKSLFETGGIQAVDSEGFADLSQLAAAFKASGAEFACLCSSDKVYAEHAEATAKALQTAGSRLIYLAGRPTDTEAALRAAGVTGFVFAGGDALATLQDAYRRMEQP